MPQNITVVIDVEACEPVQQGQVPQPVGTRIKLSPTANSHGEALVLALRQGADVAAARLGILDQMGAPPEVDALLKDMLSIEVGDAAADGNLMQLRRNWARRLAAVYGLKLTDES